MRKSFYFFTIIFLLVYSCEKENRHPDYQRSDLIRQIGNSEADMQVFTYYNTGSIYEYLTRFSYTKYYYDSHNRLVKSEIARSLNPLSCAIIPGTGFEDGEDPRKAKPGEFTEYDYNVEGKLAEKHSYIVYDDVPQHLGYEVYRYEGDRVVRKDTYNPQDQLSAYFTYQYDSNGNATEESYFLAQQDGEGVLYYRILAEFDNMHNPLSVFAVEGTPGPHTNANNIVRLTNIDYYGDTPYSHTTEYEYEYNNLGYPVLVNGVAFTYGEGE